MNFANRYNGLPEIAHRENLPLVFIETNTGSCDGHVGVADAFGAAFWAIDTGMQVRVEFNEDIWGSNQCVCGLSLPRVGGRV
jgi:hypothetical protein